jgi:hypothetical protein
LYAIDYLGQLGQAPRLTTIKILWSIPLTDQINSADRKISIIQNSIKEDEINFEKE